MRLSLGGLPDVNVSDRITRDVGWVADRWLRELRAGRAFGGFASVGAGAGVQGHAQLFNPVGSGITVIVYRVYLTVLTTTSILMSHYNTALTTLATTTRNMLSGGTAPVAEVRSQTNTGSFGSLFWRSDLTASTGFNIGIEWLSELGAGEGLVILCGNNNTEMNGSYFWIEI